MPILKSSTCSRAEHAIYIAQGLRWIKTLSLLKAPFWREQITTRFQTQLYELQERNLTDIPIHFGGFPPGPSGENQPQVFACSSACMDLQKVGGHKGFQIDGATCPNAVDLRWFKVLWGWLSSRRARAGWKRGPYM